MADFSGFVEKRLKPFLQWACRPIFLWGPHLSAPPWFVAIVAILALKGMWLLGGGERISQRWGALDAETSSQCYLDLVLSRPTTDGCDRPWRKPIVKRFPEERNWNTPHVSVYSVAPTPHSAMTLRDLSDRGQEEAIRVLGKLKDDDLPRTMAELQKTLNDSEAAGQGNDPFKFERVLVATVTKGASWDPGDRMMWTRVFVQPINFSFASYTVANTDNETLKVASVEATSSRKISADLGLTIPGVEAPKASADPSSEHSVKTTADINVQYEKLGIDIKRDFLSIIRESETGGDVVGNTTVALTTVTDPLTIWNQFPRDQCGRVQTQTEAPSNQASVECLSDRMDEKRYRRERTADQSVSQSEDSDIVLLVRQFYAPGENPNGVRDKDTANGQPYIDMLPQAPVPHCSLRARVWMLYAERQVDWGDNKYFDEARQEVTLRRDAVPQEDLEVVNADEVSPAVWSLQICIKGNCETTQQSEFLTAAPTNGGKDRHQFLTAALRKGGKDRRVVFTDYAVAVRLAQYLRDNTKGDGLPISNYTFNYKRSLSSAESSGASASVAKVASVDSSDASSSEKDVDALVPFKKTIDECRPRDSAKSPTNKPPSSLATWVQNLVPALNVAVSNPQGVVSAGTVDKPFSSRLPWLRDLFPALRGAVSNPEGVISASSQSSP
jgi:hypothetical protein